ncbi:hypothetical protein KIL84_019250 [Mauremys mutica]|uniref:Uncharacterized protein n=1 Tax=Mauremys mutica TaxID=74926 RepID=A0A9D3XW08_9SAUR|nr:hypothetical protein KIL84_019250 [Mauremys mutica]
MSIGFGLGTYESCYKQNHQSGDMSLIQSVLICRVRFSNVISKTPMRPSAALHWPASTFIASIMPNSRACLVEEGKATSESSTKPSTLIPAAERFFQEDDSPFTEQTNKEENRKSRSRAAAITVQSAWPFEKLRPVSYYIRNDTSEGAVQSS